jgi:hypothetical protein
MSIKFVLASFLQNEHTIRTRARKGRGFPAPLYLPALAAFSLSPFSFRVSITHWRKGHHAKTGAWTQLGYALGERGLHTVTRRTTTIYLTTTDNPLASDPQQVPRQAAILHTEQRGLCLPHQSTSTFHHHRQIVKSLLTRAEKIVYLPATATPALQSFAAPILNLHDTHVAAPFFGPNVWTAIVQPVPGGNIPVEHAALELKMTFKDGGAFDFHSTYERIKERLQQAVDVARESGQLVGDGTDVGGGGGGPLSGINLALVDLDELPAYEDATSPAGQTTGRSLAVDEEEAHQQLVDLDEDSAPPMSSPRSDGRSPRQEVFTPPAEPPPGYETVQSQSVADEVERRLRGGWEARFPDQSHIWPLHRLVPVYILSMTID